MSMARDEAIQCMSALIESQLEVEWQLFTESMTVCTVFSSFEKSRALWIEENYNRLRDQVLSDHPGLARACALQISCGHRPRSGKVIDLTVQTADLPGERFVDVTSDEEEPPRKKVCADGGITEPDSPDVIVVFDNQSNDLGEPASPDVIIHFDEEHDNVDGRAGCSSSASSKASNSASSFPSHSTNENKDKKRCYVCGTWTLCPLRLKDPDCPHIACSLRCLHRLSPQWIDIKFGLQELEQDLAPTAAVEEPVETLPREKFCADTAITEPDSPDVIETFDEEPNSPLPHSNDIPQDLDEPVVEQERDPSDEDDISPTLPFWPKMN